MKKLLAIGMILLSTSAWAEWTKFGTNSHGDEYYLDLATKKRGALPRVWVFTKYKQPLNGRTSATKVLKQADCAAGTVRDLSASYFSDAQAQNQLFADDSPSQFSYPPPESFQSAIFEELCGKAP
jgi:hypothetical protein